MAIAICRGVVLGILCVATSSLGACAVSEEETATDESEVQQSLDAPELPRLWIPRTNFIDPGGRLLSCLHDPRKNYFSRDVEECASIRFFCVFGTTPFSDRCGCGCEIGSSRE